MRHAINVRTKKSVLARSMVTLLVLSHLLMSTDQAVIADLSARSAADQLPQLHAL